MSTMIEFASLLSNLAVSFINISVEEIDGGINQALKRIGEYAKADRSFIFIFSEDGSSVRNVYEWVAKGIKPEIKNSQKQSFRKYPWFLKRIKKGEMVNVPRVKDLPQEAKPEKERWIGMDIQSLICLPIYGKGEVIGFIGFDAVRKETKWQEDTLALLKISGEIIANVMARWEADQAQQSKVAELSVLQSLSMVMTEANSVEELVVGSLTILGETFYTHNSGIALVDEEAGILRAIHKDFEGRMMTEKFPLGDGIVGRVVETGKSVRVEDVSKDPDFVEVFEDIKSEMCVPIISAEKVIGCINIESRTLGAYSQRDQDLVEIFSRQLATGIEKLRLFEQVQELAIRDSLTELYNRRHFFELAEAEFAKATRYGTPLSVIMMDVDDFKEVNDVYGHGLGDQMLMAVGEVFRKGLRISDIAGRYGGDEFVVMLTGSDIQAAKLLSERLDKLTRNLQVSGTRGTVSITFSQGIAILDETCHNLDILLDHADQALLVAKRTRTGQLLVWGEDVYEDS